MATCDNINNFSSSQVTRVKLLGVGIVCGLEVFRDSQCFISITKGVGVTSTGHVICIADKTLKYYREYADPNYYFQGLINCRDSKGSKKCKLWELLPQREEGAISIVPQNTASIEKPFLDDKVVLLYLEDEAKMIVRILLIDQVDMWDILKCTCIYNTHCIPTEPREEEDISIFDREKYTSLPAEDELYSAVHKKYMLNEVTIRRFGYGHIDIGDLYPEHTDERNLNPNFDFTNPPDKGREKFFSEYEVIIDETLKTLDDEIDKLHGYFGCMIDACHCKEKKNEAQEKSPCNPVTTDAPTETGLQMHNIKIFSNYFTFINKKWAAFKKHRQPVESIQYFYDFIKDLVKTYNELLNELYDLMDECCPDTDCFPRHLMLGRVKEEVSFQPSIFRQPYLQPPVFNDNADRLQKIRFLHWRMVIMMKCFFIPDWELDDMSDESYYDVLFLENEKRLADDLKDYLPLRITPGRLFREPLGRQAIPFYYNLSNSPYSLQNYWDYKATKNNREDHQLSYFCKEVPGYSNLDLVVHPFLFSLDHYPFYRIEGHTSMKLAEAVQAIKNLRRRYALSFQVVPVTFEDLKNLFSSDDAEIPAYGLEHVGGVEKGYTFLLLHDGTKAEPGIVIADFQVPFMIPMNATSPGPPPPPPPPPAPPQPNDADKERKEKAGKEWMERLEKINRQVTRKTSLRDSDILSPETVEGLSRIQVEFFEQLAMLTPQDVVLINIFIDKPIPNMEESIKKAVEFLRTGLMNTIGPATGKDDLKKIKGIKANIETLLNKAGISTYQQLSKLTKGDIPILAREIGVLEHVIKEEWFMEAKALM